jgi:tRNA(Ile2) C34 agmatinyltransferase TiaS
MNKRNIDMNYLDKLMEHAAKSADIIDYKFFMSFTTMQKVLKELVQQLPYKTKSYNNEKEVCFLKEYKGHEVVQIDWLEDDVICFMRFAPNV